MNVTRRQMLTLLTAVPVATLVSCGLEANSPHSATSRTAVLPDRPSTLPVETSKSPRVLSAESSRWRPGPGEVSPKIKQSAAAFLETAGNWTGGGTAVDNLLRAGASPRAAATATILQPVAAGTGALTVIYPQYGGLTADNAAVIALVSQRFDTPSGEQSRELVVDTRLTRQAGDVWTVEQLRPLTSLGTPVALSDTAEAVLAEPRIMLPGPSRSDVGTGRMSDPLLRVLLELSQEFTLTVQVMHTGHIQTVFPTDRLSNHAVGRAVDIREIDGQAVVDIGPFDDRQVRLMRRAAELGATEVGDRSTSTASATASSPTLSTRTTYTSG